MLFFNKTPGEVERSRKKFENFCKKVLTKEGWFDIIAKLSRGQGPSVAGKHLEN